MPKVPSSRSNARERREKEGECPRLFESEIIQTKQIGFVTISKVLADRLLWYEDGYNPFFIEAIKLPKFVENIIDESTWREVLTLDQTPKCLRSEGVTHMKFTKIFQGQDTLNIRSRLVDLGGDFVGDVSEGSYANFLVSVIVSTRSGKKIVSKLFAQSQFAICGSHNEIEGEEKKFFFLNLGGKNKRLYFSFSPSNRSHYILFGLLVLLLVLQLFRFWLQT